MAGAGRGIAKLRASDLGPGTRNCAGSELRPQILKVKLHQLFDERAGHVGRYLQVAMDQRAFV
jgi:hypothetical protein